MTSFVWLIFSYLLGSFPSGYLISRWSGKDILKVGWRKTSGTNVFRNVGRWQGALTGILDVLKGYLAVYGAQKLDVSLFFQVLAGVAAVSGHNWSIFLKFAGGRGIGTFIGAFFALSPKILGFSLIPFALLALIWNASIGTLLFLATTIFLSYFFNQWEIVGIFTALSLAPILIKRLSPIKEISKDQNPTVLFRNRFLFDNDKSCLDLRIKRLFKKNSQKLSRVVRSLTSPVLLPPKIGWKAAKFGVEVAKKPIERLIGLSPEIIVTEIDQNQLKEMMIASARKVVLHQEEINRINVWPVADKDTGYNLAATLLGIEGAISQKEYQTLREITRDIKESALMNARGNAGMIFTGYLIRFLDQIRNLDTINCFKLALAMRKGTKAAYLSIINPTEGTILDVMKAAGEKVFEMVKKEKPSTRAKPGAGNIIKILEEALKMSQEALAETKEKLEVLKRNDVVDAGALGFVKILEAWIESLKGLVPAGPPEKKEPLVFEPKPEEKLEYRHDLVFVFRKPKREIDLGQLKKSLSLVGGSIDIVELEDKIKTHIHTNFPEKVKENVKEFEILEWKVEDMASQMKQIVRKKPLGLVVGETADLPPEFLEKNQIIEIPFVTRFPSGEILEKENLFLKLQEARQRNQPLPIASAPPFQDFLSAYQKALEKFEEILVITISSKLSGTYSSARIARSMVKEKQRIAVFDCFSAEIGEGLTAIKVQELISQGKNKKEILEILKDFCPRIKLIGCLQDFSYVVRSGRILLPEIIAKVISLFSLAGIQFLFGIEKGRAKFSGIKFGKDKARILIREIEKERQGKKIRIAIAYGNNLKEALELRGILEENEGAKVLFLSQVSAVVGVYTGPEVLIVGYYREEND